MIFESRNANIACKLNFFFDKKLSKFSIVKVFSVSALPYFGEDLPDSSLATKTLSRLLKRNKVNKYNYPTKGL